MPKIQVNRNEFEELLGEKISDQKLRDEASLLGAHWFHVENDKWEVEVYPDRPDLLSVEGLARAYRNYFEFKDDVKSFETSEGPVELQVEDSVDDVRPYIGGAVVRNLELSERVINGLIQFQEKLHESMGRKRDKLAIGLHDLSKVEPPFSYRAVEPSKVAFKPLDYDHRMELGEILEEHEKGREYSWILEDEEKYPVILDKNDNVLSFPPIINNQLTEVSTGTTDIFIDVTGKHERTVREVLNIIVTALEERGGVIETVNVAGEKMPVLEPEEKELEVDYFRSVSGLNLDAPEIASELEKMNLRSEPEEGSIKVKIPPYRTDIMHQYDLIEDVVIAYGYGNVEPELPEISQTGSQKPIEDIDSRLRETMVSSGAMETNTYYLSSREKLFDKMEIEEEEIVRMSNALNENFSVLRNWLLPSLLEVLRNNRHQEYPQEFFETSETGVLDDSHTGASNVRKIAYLKTGNNVDYTDAREKLQVIERDLGVELEIESEEKGCFVDGRSAVVKCSGEEIGIIGQFSDQVMENWDMDQAASGFELDVGRIMELE